MQRAFYFVYMNRISTLLWKVFIIYVEFIDNMKVKIKKIQHEKEKSICFPTRKDSMNHNIQTPSMRKL